MALNFTQTLALSQDVVDVLTNTAFLNPGAYDYVIPPFSPILGYDGSHLSSMPGSPLSDTCLSEDSDTFPFTTSIPPLALPEPLLPTRQIGHNKKRGKANRAKKRQEQGKHERHIDQDERRRHVLTEQTIPVASNTADIPVAETGYLGLLGDDHRKKAYQLDELVGENSRFKMRCIPYTGP